MLRPCRSFDGMVQLLQLVLQLYSARVLRTKDEQGVEGALNQVRDALHGRRLASCAVLICCAPYDSCSQQHEGMSGSWVLKR
jgi:hypothetical protein